MKKTSSFFVGQWLGRVSRWAKHNLHNFPNHLNIVCHEAFELWHLNSISFHDLHKGPPHKNLKLHVLLLHVTYCNYHDVGIDMVCHGSPTRNTFIVAKHQPCSLQISTWLHMCNKIKATPFAFVDILNK